MLAGFPASILVVGSSAWSRRWGSSYQLLGEHSKTAHINLAKKKIWKEKYVAWIALEPWLNACLCMPLTMVFQIGVGVNSPSVEGDGKYGGNRRRSGFDHLNLFWGQKQHSVDIEHWLKSKLAWPVCTKIMKCNDYGCKWSF